MIKFSTWMENHNMSAVRGQVATDRGELGSGYEGLLDIFDALKIVAQLPGGGPVISGLAGKLTTMLPEEQKDLEARLRAGASKFVGKSKHLGNQQPLGEVPNNSNNNTPIRSAQ